MATCPLCAENYDGSPSTCPHCGSALQRPGVSAAAPAMSPSATPRGRRRGTVAAIAGAVLLIVALVCVLVVAPKLTSRRMASAPLGAGAAAKVGSREIPEHAFYFAWFVYNGPNMRPERARALRLKERIMHKLIERELFAQGAERQGIAASEKDVDAMLEGGHVIVLGVRQDVRGWFFKDGRLDRPMLERFFQLQFNGSFGAFVAEQRRELLADRMRERTCGSGYHGDGDGGLTEKCAESLVDWMRSRCTTARDAGRIKVNPDLVAYEGPAGIAPAAYRPCEM